LTNHEVIEKFYRSFQQRDGAGMQACYHDDIIFTDPVFPNLRGDEAKAMWHMLAVSAKDLTLTYGNIQATEAAGSCDWEAKYSFSRTGARVHNKIHAEFAFQDGKIIRHTDTFDLRRWAAMALGLPGRLFGWSPWMQNKIRANARQSLEKFLSANPQYRVPMHP